ncbi:MAG: carboxypeptidase-like regulatory domain-containing protein, partial [Prevotella sp.]|nr:carboxypeptidase-like regulatory domain-containing protein [Prevotella sp.]
MKKKTGEGVFYLSLFILSIFLLMAECVLFPLHARASREANEVQAEQTVKDVFSYIERNSNFVILYSKELLSELDKKVSIDTDGKKVEDILKELSSKTGLEYTINDRQITVVKRNVIPQQRVASIKITGQVLDKDGEPLVGVSVSIKGTSTGVMTDADGKFSISVTSGATLVFKYIGYIEQEIVASNQQDLRIVMQEDQKMLDEVVVVGFGKQKKESV